MTLPNGFLFSQSNLQDYTDCQRRFQLRYLDQLAWPAVEAEPSKDFELSLDQGFQFHKIVRQHFLGVPENQIEASLEENEIMRSWWHNYLHATQGGSLQFIHQPGNQLYEEITLSAIVGGFRLLAKYDLFCVSPAKKLVIVDWKTSRQRPRRAWLEARLQTRVYPFVLTQAAQAVSGRNSVEPDQIEMIYWFTNYPDQPERFTYTPAAYEEDATYLENLISTISRKTEKVFPLTPDLQRCLFCTYRSLCNRGVKPGELLQLEEWQSSEQSAGDVSIDYEQIGEIEF
ncbi:MAG: PD-(D/E)XK nuclease family protein [Acidobacteriaceae bacterium]